MTRWGGALLYAAVLLAIVLPCIDRTMTVPALDPSMASLSLAAGLPAVLITSPLSARLGTWLGEVGRGSTAPFADHLSSRTETVGE